MSATADAALNDGTHVMDGHSGRRHLVRELGMREVAAPDAGPVTERFNSWLANDADALTIRGGTPTSLLPPAWYAGMGWKMLAHWHGRQHGDASVGAMRSSTRRLLRNRRCRWRAA